MNSSHQFKAAPDLGLQAWFEIILAQASTLSRPEEWNHSNEIKKKKKKKKKKKHLKKVKKIYFNNTY